MYGLLLLLFSADADVRAAEIKFQGAEEMALLCKTTRDELLTLVPKGYVSKARSFAVQRRVLDANLNRECARRALVVAKGGKEPMITAAQLDILRAIERFEARRLESVRANQKRSLVTADEVERAVLRHRLAWIERNFADRLTQKGADLEAIERSKKQDAAKVRLRTAEKLIAHFEKTKPGSHELFAARAERIRALTASKLAHLPKR